MSKEKTSRSRREKLLHYRLIRRIYALLRDESWTVSYQKILKNRHVAKRLALDMDMETIGHVDEWGRKIYIDFRSSVLLVLIHECLHEFVDDSWEVPYQRRDGKEHIREEREVERLERIIHRHLSPIQAKRLHLLMAMRLK